MFKLVVLVGLFTACFGFKCGDLQLQKVGCFKKDNKVFVDMLANNRDARSKHFTGKLLNWRAFEQSLQSLACRCADKAKAEGYVAIALGFFGECHGTKDRVSFEKLTLSSLAMTNTCFNHVFGRCQGSDTKCVGDENANYIYDFPSQAPEEINGGYSEWSEYATCSASCGNGVQIRERACNNPAPENGGVGCEDLGESTESKECKIKECPINGEYSAWTSYGSCSKSCGSGLKRKTRSCNSPAPAHGGLECEGPPSHSIQCNTQPCLGSTDCVYKETQFDDDGGGEAVYLDRHSLHCPTGHVINYMKLERNSGLNKIRYRYRCCKSQLSCSDSRTTNGQTSNGGKNGNTVFFDRQTIQCNKKGISYLKLDRSGDVWNYKYDCCTVSYGSSSVTCYDLNTGFGDDGNGENIYFDRHTIKCKNDKDFVSYIKMVRNSGLDHIRFNYKCCSINVPSVTN